MHSYLARMDADGYVRIVDRQTDMIQGAGGLNVYPRKVEDVLLEHPKVKAAAVAGVPSGEKGERVKAFVVLKYRITSSADEMFAFCRENLGRYEVPRSVEFRTELPMTMVGKVLRQVVLEEEIRRHLKQPAHRGRPVKGSRRS